MPAALVQLNIRKCRRPFLKTCGLSNDSHLRPDGEIAAVRNSGLVKEAVSLLKSCPAAVQVGFHHERCAAISIVHVVDWPSHSAELSCQTWAAVNSLFHCQNSALFGNKNVAVRAIICASPKIRSARCQGTWLRPPTAWTIAS